MTWTIKVLLLLSMYFSTFVDSRFRGPRIFKEEKQYEVIDFKIPLPVWRQAINPTPVLKSPVTIVVPIHVNDQYNDVEDDTYVDEVTEENVGVNATAAAVEDEPVIITTPAPVSVTQEPVEDPPQVTGQVTRFPCSCIEGQCGCCTGAILQRFNMKACGNISFVPEDFAFDVKLNVNNNTVVHRRVSASDPPPICFNPRRAPFVRVCAEISNIQIRNRNAFACMDINADIAGFQIYSASFRCFSMGASGVKTGLKEPKPVSGGPPTVNLFGGNNDEEGGGFLENAAGLLGGEESGIFGGSDSGGIFGGGSDDDEGPFDGIGDEIAEAFGGRDYNPWDTLI